MTDLNDMFTALLPWRAVQYGAVTVDGKAVVSSKDWFGELVKTLGERRVDVRRARDALSVRPSTAPLAFPPDHR